MRVKIISAKYPTLWYADCVGDIFEVEDEKDSEGDYRLMNDNGKYISSASCEIVEATLPAIEYHGATTVVRWPDGVINSAKPCQAQPEKKIKADTFDPTIGFLHCIAKKYLPDYKKIIANAVEGK